MLELFLSTFATLFVTIDPIGVFPLFLAFAAPLGQVGSRALATRGVLLATGILVFIALAGNAFLGLLGISLDSFRIAGGILLFVIALEMVFERRTKRRAKHSEKAVQVQEADDNQDWRSWAVFPMAFPFLAGPGAMTSLILYSGEHPTLSIGFGIVMAALLGVMATAWLIYWIGSGLARFITPQISEIMTRVLGVILAAMAVEFVVQGIKALVG